MAKEGSVSISLKNDRKGLKFQVVDKAGNELHVSQLDTPEVDQLIRTLSNLRVELDEPVTEDLDEGAFIADCIVDPKIRLGRRKAEDGRELLIIRHPGFGWLGFRLREQIVDVLIERLGGQQK